MSKLNISRNIFLEKEELTRFQEFVGNDNVASQVLLENTTNWGIVRTTFDANYVDFKVELGTNLGTIQIANLSKAVDIDKLLIKLDPTDNIAIPSDGIWYWLKISQKYSPIEVGQCSVNVNGVVSGVNTKFTEVLRGQSTEVPVKIKFVKNGLVNTGEYEVVDVVDDLNLILAGTGFSAESALTYFVIGSTPISEVLTAQQLEGLYQYDSCALTFVQEEILDTPPITNYTENKDFYIARIQKNGGSVVIEDKRGTQFLTFNVEGVDNKLDKDQNLADLTDVAAARANLNVSTNEEISAAFFGDSGWQAMTRGVGANATGYDIKIRRFGKMITITGKFTTGNGSPGSIIASIPYSGIGNGARTVNKIYFTTNDISSLDRNRGMKAYVKQFVEGDTSLQLIIHSSDQEVTDMFFTVTYIGE